MCHFLGAQSANASDALNSLGLNATSAEESINRWLLTNYITEDLFDQRNFTTTFENIPVIVQDEFNKLRTHSGYFITSTDITEKFIHKKKDQRTVCRRHLLINYLVKEDQETHGKGEWRTKQRKLASLSLRSEGWQRLGCAGGHLLTAYAQH